MPSQEHIETIRSFVLRAKRQDRGLCLSLPLLTLAGWMTRDHQRVTDYLLAENAVMREQLRDRRIVYTDAQRRRLAMTAKKLGRKLITPMNDNAQLRRRTFGSSHDAAASRRARAYAATSSLRAGAARGDAEQAAARFFATRCCRAA